MSLWDRLKCLNPWTLVLLVRHVVYGRRVVTSNLWRVLTNLTWILQHESSEQWKSHVTDSPIRLCASVTKPVLSRRPRWHSLCKSLLPGPKAFKWQDLQQEKSSEMARKKRKKRMTLYPFYLKNWMEQMWIRVTVEKCLRTLWQTLMRQI